MSWKWRLAQAAEIRWWRFYLAGRGRKDYLRAKGQYWLRVLAAAGVDPLPGERVLDAGCGPAGIFMVLTAQRVDAVDPLLEKYAADLPHFSRDDYPYAIFYNQRLEDFRITAPYPLVFCLNAINHVADLKSSMDQLARATQSGGTLLLGVDTHRRAFLKKIFRVLPGDILHPHQHVLGDYLGMLQHRGFIIERTICIKPGRIFDYHLVVARRKKDDKPGTGVL